VPSKKTLIILLALYLSMSVSIVYANSVLPGVGLQKQSDQATDKAGPLHRAIAWVWTKQRQFHRRLTHELGGVIRNEGSALVLVLVSFLYGIFHAAGPGHGKAVLTTYLLTHGREVRRGIAMASATALTQGVTAVILVYGLILAAGWLPRDTHSAVDWTERLSFLLVTGVGLFLLWHGVRGIWRSLRKRSSAEPTECLCDSIEEIQPDQIKQAKNWRAFLGVVLAVGLRPCSGAVLILIFAHAMHIHWAGIAAVAAMSLGTAITVSTLALLAINARRWAVAFTQRSSSRWWRVGGGITLMFGGILISAIGLSLLIYSFGPQHPLGL
jgi:ABC-type nickel/cobalt efflux system permease component RcnA